MSPELLQLVKESETCRLTRYLDPIGLPTIGWGHLLRADEQDVVHWTQEQADAALAADLAQAEGDALRLCPNLTGRRLDAFTDLVYNVGAGKLEATGHHTLQALRDENWPVAAKMFEAWCHAGGKVLLGLVIRRSKEAEWILNG